MKILVDSFNECFQNDMGGVRIKIEAFVKYMSKLNNVKLFDKWNDKISDYDILHVFKAGVQNHREIRFAKELGLKVIISAVAEKEKNSSITIKKAISKLPLNIPYSILRKNYELADCIIAETNYEREYISKAYKIKTEKIIVLPNGIDIDYQNDYKKLFAEKYGIKDSFVLQVGRFDANKNQLSTIRALKGTGVKLVFIGGPDKDEPQYFERCKKEADSNVLFVGWVDHNDPMLVSAYQNCHTFILPSHKEILGNALLEAGACGANLLSTNVLPLSDWGIEKECLSFNPSDVDDIREKVMISLKTNKKNQLAGYISERFDWSAIIQEHDRLCRKLIQE